MSSCNLISYLLRHPQVRVKFLCTTRPIDASAPFAMLLRDEEVGRFCTQIEVDPISEESIEAYLNTCVSDRFAEGMDVKGLGRLVQAKTNGNPFFIRQVSPLHLIRRIMDRDRCMNFLNSFFLLFLFCLFVSLFCRWRKRISSHVMLKQVTKPI
jgi:hypothetical protein